VNYQPDMRDRGFSILVLDMQSEEAFAIVLE
jgi:hypothetical protein